MISIAVVFKLVISQSAHLKAGRGLKGFYCLKKQNIQQSEQERQGACFATRSTARSITSWSSEAGVSLHHKSSSRGKLASREKTGNEQKNASVCRAAADATSSNANQAAMRFPFSFPLSLSL